MKKLDSVVIVGAGLAGASAAFELRKLGYEGRVVLVGAEEQVPYERPPLSKDYLRGESTLDEAFVRPAANYDVEAIEFLPGRTVTQIDPAERLVELDDGRSLRYSTLVLATGAEPRRLELAGDVPSLHYLRTAADADRIKSAAAEAHSVAVIGSGWIGSEVAASLRQLGRSVTMISNAPRPLERVLGAAVGDVYRQLHVEHGVDIVQGSAGSLEGRNVALSDGTHVAADMFVVGIGAIPRIGLAEDAGLQLRDGGIAVDEYLRSSAPGIFAVGDIATAWHPRLRRYIRVEHWDNAKRQGRAVAANILGSGKPYMRTPYFYSDQFDLAMEYRGFAPLWEQVVIRGDLAAREFDAFWLADGRVVAAMNANRPDDGAELLALVESGHRVDIARLTDPTINLAEAA